MCVYIYICIYIHRDIAWIWVLGGTQSTWSDTYLCMVCALTDTSAWSHIYVATWLKKICLHTFCLLFIYLFIYLDVGMYNYI